MIQKITAPKSLGAIGVLVISIGMMQEPHDAIMIYIGVALCVIGYIQSPKVKR